jgi:hypothetical protein
MIMAATEANAIAFIKGAEVLDGKIEPKKETAKGDDT